MPRRTRASSPSPMISRDSVSARARIRDALIAADPSHGAGYQSRAASYLADLDRLDAEIRSKVAQIPPARRKLVTSHDAFPYYATAYGLSVIGFTQPEEGKEPSPAELAAL